MMLMESVSSSSSHDAGGYSCVEFSETFCSVAFNCDDELRATSPHDVTSTSTSLLSHTSSDDQFGISCKTITYNEGISPPDDYLSHFHATF